MKIEVVSSRLRFSAQQCIREAQEHDHRCECAIALRSVALQCAQTARALDNGLGFFRTAAELIERAQDDIVESAMQRTTDLAIDEVLHG